MTTSLHSRSSWISSMLYKRTPDGTSYLALILKPYTRANGCQSEPTALLYGGPEQPLPSWLPGLITAGRAGKGSSDKASPGRVYHRLVKGKYRGQTIKGEKEVNKLKEMMS